MEELVKAGVTTQDIINGGLSGALSLATAGGLELADAAEIASTALNAFKDDNLSVAQAWIFWQGRPTLRQPTFKK